ncbi:MAG TPA: hypothetical protein VFS69_00365 [Sphingomicrobium sp.]|jgi:hypothetical protein|nr:hypothetical protein [Sphingomicrobium sp.]
MASGYSGTPLAQKLSLKDGMRVWWDCIPDSVRAEIDGAGFALKHRSTPIGPLDEAHIFVRHRDVLDCKLRMLLPMLDPAGMIWVSWPKKAAKTETDITEDTIRAVALPMGLVDVKVCAVDDTWSGLKLVIRKQNR